MEVQPMYQRGSWIIYLARKNRSHYLVCMEITQDWSANFDGTRALSPDLRKMLLENSKILHFKKGDLIFSPDKPSNYLLFLLSGQVRVQQVNENGREIVLFRAVAGQSCVMTTAGLLSDQDSAADGIAESDVEAAAVPRGSFDRLMAESPEFRNFVLAAYNKRIRDLFAVVDEVAFGRIDIRLASRLLRLAGEGRQVSATHQDLANELGTAREVISRQLNEFQRRGLISQSRGKIDIVDEPALLAIASD